MKRFILILVFLYCAKYNFAQNNLLSFNEDKKTVATYKKIKGENLDLFLDNSKISLFRTKINENSLLSNSLATFDYQPPFQRSQKVEAPILIDAIDKYFNNNLSIEFIDFLLANGADAYSTGFRITPLYLINSYVLKEEYKSLQLFETFLKNKIKFEQITKNKISVFSDYISKTTNEKRSEKIISFFLKAGCYVNTPDEYGTPLLTSSIIKNDVEIIKLLLVNNAEVNIRASNNSLPIIEAINTNNEIAFKLLLDKSVIITKDIIDETDFAKQTKNCNKYFSKVLSNIYIKDVTKYDEAKNFILLFDESKNLLLANNKYQNIGLSYSNIPEFVTMLEANTPNFSKIEKEIILTEKVKYINGTNTIEELANALQIFPLFRLNNYTNNYYTSEENTKSLYNELKSISTIINQNLKQQLLQEILSNSTKYYANALSNSKNVEAYIQLSKNYSSKRNEIEIQCFNRFCNSSSFGDGSQNKWSEYIESYKETAQNYLTNANTYLSYFNYKKDIVIANKSAAQTAYSKAYNNFKSAKQYETTLINNVNNIKENIKNTSNLPKYNVKKYKDEYEIELDETGVPSFKRTAKQNERSGSYYVVDMIGGHGDYKSIATLIKEDMFLDYWRASLWTFEPTASKFEKMERILKEYNKYGIGEWYKMKVD
jgi:hypothetical protein